jgi:hypothetical protein
MSKSIMRYATVSLDDEKSALVIIDQTKLPERDIFAASARRSGDRRSRGNRDLSCREGNKRDRI